MASLLESQIAATVASAFKGKLLSGTIRREAPGVGVDSYGDPNPGTVSTFTFEGIRESFDADFRAQAGIPDTDVGVLVLLGLVTPATEPRQGDQVEIRGQWHHVRRVMGVDPASAAMRLQCYEIDEPIDPDFFANLDFSQAGNSGYLPVIGA